MFAWAFPIFCFALSFVCNYAFANYLGRRNVKKEAEKFSDSIGVKVRMSFVDYCRWTNEGRDIHQSIQDGLFLLVAYDENKLGIKDEYGEFQEFVLEKDNVD